MNHKIKSSFDFLAYDHWFLGYKQTIMILRMISTEQVTTETHNMTEIQTDPNTPTQTIRVRVSKGLNDLTHKFSL